MTLKPDWMTNDKLEAGVRGYGVLAMPALAVANSVASDVLQGLSIKLDDAAAPRIPLDIILQHAVDVAMKNGVSPSNAALLAAATVYLAGSGARAGVPMANRKVGAMARIYAGATRTTAISLSTNKFTNRITAFPAYLAVYQELMDKKLTKIDGDILPLFLSGGAIYGHSALGEDYMVPELAFNAAKVGAEAMRKAFAGAGMTPSPLWCGLIAAAVTMEIVHPDSFVPEDVAPFGAKTSSYFAGKGAVAGAKLPEKIHWRLTGEEVETADIIGDFGLILKDIGGPSMIGSMALNEMFAGFEEAPLMYAGFSGGPVNAPTGHLHSDAIPVIRVLMQNGGDLDDAAEKLRKDKLNRFIDPEMAMVGTNNVAKKAEQINRGPVTDVLIKATEPIVVRAAYRRAVKAYEMLKQGKTVGDVAHALDEERLHYVEKRGSMILSGFLKMLGVLKEGLEIKFTDIHAQARRHDPFTAKYWGFDSYISYDVTMDGKKYHIENLSAKATPEYVIEGKNRDDPMYNWALFVGNVVSQELQYIGFSIMNITIPAAIAVAMGQDIKKAAKEAEKGAYLTAAIPGGKVNARLVGNMAKQIVEFLKMKEHDILPPM